MALIKQPLIEDETHLRAWLIRVAVNKCKDLLKSAARRNTIALEAAINKYSLNADDIGVIECINRLKPIERDIIILHYVEGFSVKEVGEMIGKKENAIFKNLERLRNKLKEILEE